MSVAPVPVPVAISKNVQAGMSKNIVLDLGQFNGNQTKFQDWQRGIRLFLKNNRVMKTDDRITAILARLREGVVGIYVQRKLDKLDEETGIQDWEEFVQEIKTVTNSKPQGWLRE